MCGIVGYTGSNLEIVKRAHALQAHRGPDDAGFYNDEHISLGHNRLAIIDLNPRSAQPMWDTSHRYCIVFNGEIYNYQELKHDHLSDYDFQTESDTEVILALFSKYGTAITQYLRGMYAFTIYDKVEKDVYLFRDTFGIKPLYYTVGKFGICFGSEIKSIVAILSDLKEKLSINRDSIDIYLTLGHTITPDTIYNEIKLMRPGTIIKFAIKSQQLTHTLQEQHETHEVISERVYEKIIRDTVHSHMIADVPVGVFFSGGVDSSLIAAYAKDKNSNLNTFSLNINGRDVDRQYINKISSILKLKNESEDFGVEEFEQSYQEVTKTIDNPSGANGIFQTYYISKKASKNVKVVLLGDGGDELFYGYNRSLFLGKFTSPVPNQEWFDSLFFLTPSFPGKNKFFFNLAKLLKMPLFVYLNEMSIERDESSRIAWKKIFECIKREAIPPSLLDFRLYLQDGLLVKNDLATSMCSIEGRLPLLDRAIHTHAHKFANLSITMNHTKYFLKKLLDGILPHELILRKKMGFGLNYTLLNQHSSIVYDDYKSAVSYLQERNIRFNFKPFDHYIKKSTQMTLVVNALYKSLENNERIYGSKII